MNTLHPESPVYESTEASMGQLLEQYDMSVDITIRSVSVSGDSAEADVEQTTRETSGAADYQDNRSQLLHELRTHEGEWKIYSSTMLDREFL